MGAAQQLIEHLFDLFSFDGERYGFLNHPDLAIINNKMIIRLAFDFF